MFFILCSRHWKLEKWGRKGVSCCDVSSINKISSSSILDETFCADKNFHIKGHSLMSFQKLKSFHTVMLFRKESLSTQNCSISYDPGQSYLASQSEKTHHLAKTNIIIFRFESP